ncbi:molybdopterin-dependent oxidoreductase [Thioclava sp. A2]|uniref:molybdopterin-dependent oxidoreductase n=1 Tax=Thioclava sp. FCG-A2 TaxID=3080562 RepID=UPI0029554B89|nr:molybdopterin-dependent oxidoreductase [Thioclava sp. A2]MDV7271007.1 molybdopterin-dependent oxidoreductase [Thioclava sp. A2]
MDGSSLPEIRSTCPYCGVGCGVLLRGDGHGGLTVRGDTDHPANKGRLCSKGSALGETVGRAGRLTTPLVNGAPSDWNSALDLVASTLTRTIAEHGPDSVAFYVSGQLLTEDYYVANKLMKGFIGSANIDTNSRLCMASTVAGHKRAFGTDTVPGTYEDLDEADLVVLVGSNLAWCHPVLHQRLLAARKARPQMKLVVIDPRRTASCDGADLHLALKPGSDVALFNGLLAQIAAQGAIDGDFAPHLDGLEAALASARADDTAQTGLDPASLGAFFDLWIGTKKVVTVFSQGVNQSSSGTDKVNAILNCHLVTGRIGKPGCGPFSVTGQPNAMGGREVGGLANMLACHLDLENPAHRDAVKQFWSAPAMPEQAGLKAVDLFRAVAQKRIKALWIIHTNPAVTLPDASAVRTAIEGCDFVVVSDVTGATDTARLADVLLPATAWAEKSGTVTNSDRTISRQRAALAPPGATRPDWDTLAEVGRRMGWAGAFDYRSPAQIFREYAALSGIAGAFGRDFDISGLSEISDTDYEGMPPQRWPVSATKTGGRFFADGQFFHADKKARLIAVRNSAPKHAPDAERPFLLNTGRLRDQWHTMTRTALSPRLSAHRPEPFAELHPADAAALGIGQSDLVALSNELGQVIVRAQITDAVAQGQIFVPMHWTGETAPTARIDTLVRAVTDPVSGQPESKASTVSISRFAARWYGFAISTDGFRPKAEYWAVAKTASGTRAELAGMSDPADWESWARDLFGLPHASLQSVSDETRGLHRLAFEQDGRLLAALFISREPVAVMRDYLSSLPGTDAPEALSGRTPPNRPDPGPIICSCFGVGMNTILAAIETDGLSDVDAIGAALKAGTNCGSCRPEIAALLARASAREAAE